jgi:hypothetical protein
MIEQFMNVHVLVRCASSGVHFGVLKQWDGKQAVLLEDSRRLWEWSTGGTGISLSEVSVCGIDQKRSKISMALPEHLLLDAIEIMKCHGVAVASIAGAEVAKP